MAAVWRCLHSADGSIAKDVCVRCAALDGRRDGDGWSSSAAPNWKRVNGEWVRVGDVGKVGPPPLHPNCRCGLVEVSDDQAAFVDAVVR